MKTQMKLRTRLFLAISSLMAVALLGLLLGLFSVLQMATGQEQLFRDNFAIVDANQALRRNLGDQLALLGDGAEIEALQPLQVSFATQLQSALQNPDPKIHAAYEQVATDFAEWKNALQHGDADSQNDQAFKTLRGQLVGMQEDALRRIAVGDRERRETSLLIAGLLGVVGVAVLLVGFITAQSFASRFGAPIERLAHAADQIGRGDFNVVLPVSPISELALLIRRFGLMTEALRSFEETNVEALRSGQQRLQALLDSIDDGLLIVDRQGRLEHTNPVAQRQLAWTSEHLGLTLGEALHDPRLDEAVGKVLADIPLEGPQDDLQIEVGGENRLLAWRLSSFSHADGRIIGAVLVLRDVTSQRAFDRIRNEFVLRASHELRTPVTGMHMAFGLLRERVVFPAESREADLLQTVDEEMRRLVRLINDLLNFSRYQSGQQKLEPSPCEPADLLIEARRRYLEQAHEKGVDLVLEFQDQLPRLQLDALQMERVFDHLLDNALRYTPRGGSIRLQGRRHGDRVILSVEDSGEGIPYSQQARIFEPFVQIGRKQGGAGLGLALCKEIVRLHSGRLGVHSRLGEGTVFYLALPV